MIRILIISWEFPPHVVGGMGKHVAELVPELDVVGDSAVYIDVLTIHSGGSDRVEWLSDAIRVIRVNAPAVDPHDMVNSVVDANEALAAAARNLAAVHAYDLIHVHDWLTAEAGITLKHDWKCPLLVTVHATERGRHQGHLSNDHSRKINHIEGRVIYEAWRVIVCSQYMASQVVDYFDAAPDKIDVIPNGLNLGDVQPCTVQESLGVRHRYAPHGERLLFFVGRIVHEKGLHVLLRAMPLILDRYPDVRLMVAGRNSSQMVDVARRLGVLHAISFLDYISDAHRDCIYQTVDAAVIPSLYEPFGIVALEAMALDCNLIVSNVGGLSEVVTHGETGLTVYPDDPASIAWAVDQLFRFPQAAEQRRQNALYAVRTHFNWATIARRTVEVYEAVVAARMATAW